MYLSLLADRKSRQILGVEAIGRHGDAVKARVDTVAVLLKDGVDVDEICSLETGYAPPFASAMDVINNAGNALDNILAGSNRVVDAADFLDAFYHGEKRVLDIRGKRESQPFIERYGERWLNIPQPELRKRINEIPQGEPFFLFCDTGARSYEAQVFLTSVGITNTLQVQGGLAMVRMTNPLFG